MASRINEFLKNEPIETEIKEEKVIRVNEEINPDIKKPKYKFENIKYQDSFEHSKSYTINEFTKVNGINKYKTVKFKRKFVTDENNLPMCIPQIPEDEKNLSDKQREWKNNVIEEKDLKVTTPKTVKSNNRLGWRKYIFINELIANKNGLLYYLIPLLISITLLFINFKKHDFIINISVALVALFYILMIRKIIKSPKSIIHKIFYSFLLIILLIPIILILVYFPDIRNKIYIPFTIKLLTIIFGIYYFGKFYGIFALAYAGDLRADFGNVVQVKAGPPGCGKSSLGAHESYVMALLKWQQLQYDFFIWHSKEKEILKRNNTDELLEYQIIKESYNFYIMRPCIPCLWSNICIEDSKKRRSFKITLNHIRGVDKLPLYSVVFFDEIGTVLRSEMSKDKGTNYDVSDMFRLGRHFLKWSVIACEQDFNNIYIDCRRVVGCNQLLSSQEWTCRPLLIYSVLNILKWIVSDSIDKKVRRLPIMAKILVKLEKFVHSIGFRKYRYNNVGNTQTSNDVVRSDDKQEIETIGTDKIRYVPSTLLCHYDDRAYKQLYPSYYDKKINGKVHESLCISGLDIEYGRQYISNTDLTDEKRTIVDKELKNLRKIQ